MKVLIINCSSTRTQKKNIHISLFFKKTWNLFLIFLNLQEIYVLKMKHIKFVTALLFIILLSISLSSCSDNSIDDMHTIKSQFSFDGIYNSDPWKNATSFDKKMQMSQIPDSILHQLSTDQLVALCAKHPLNVICNAYDNPMIGAKYIVQETEQQLHTGWIPCVRTIQLTSLNIGPMTSISKQPQIIWLTKLFTMTLTF